MERESPLEAPGAIGEREPVDTLAVRNRLTGAYKGLHANIPAALDAYALLMSQMQDRINGSLLPVCRSLGMTPKQYQHISEGLNGDGVPGAYLVALLVARPGCVVPAFATMFDALGYELTPKQQTAPRLTANEAGAALSEKVGALQAETFRSLADGKFDREEARRVRECIAGAEGVLRELKAHAKKVEGRK